MDTRIFTTSEKMDIVSPSEQKFELETDPLPGRRLPEPLVGWVTSGDPPLVSIFRAF